MYLYAGLREERARGAGLSHLGHDHQYRQDQNPTSGAGTGGNARRIQGIEATAGRGRGSENRDIGHSWQKQGFSQQGIEATAGRAGVQRIGI